MFGTAQRIKRLLEGIYKYCSVDTTGKKAMKNLVCINISQYVNDKKMLMITLHEILFHLPMYTLLSYHTNIIIS